MLATDIDTNCLQRARAGVYPYERVAKLDPARLKRFFMRGRGANEGQVKVRAELADMVRFETLNLLAPHWPINEKFDAIFCRNVMIYFDKPTQARILRRFVPLLKPGGLLFAGIPRISPISAATSACADRLSMSRPAASCQYEEDQGLVRG